MICHKQNMNFTYLLRHYKMFRACALFRCLCKTRINMKKFKGFFAIQLEDCFVQYFFQIIHSEQHQDVSQKMVLRRWFFLEIFLLLGLVFHEKYCNSRCCIMLFKEMGAKFYFLVVFKGNKFCFRALIQFWREISNIR